MLLFQTVENWFDTFFLIFIICWSFTQIFVICELSERLIIRFDDIYNEIFHYNWYAFPIYIKKMLPTIMKGVQDPVVMIGFGNIYATRETFKNVSK